MSAHRTRPAQREAPPRPEFAQADTELRQRQLMEDLPAGVVMYDADLRVVSAAGEALRANGYDPDLLVGRLLSDVLPAESYAALEGPYRAALAGTSCEFVYASPVAGGRFRARVRPIFDGAGRVEGGLAMTWDVSEIMDLRVQLDHAHHLLEMGSATYHAGRGWRSDPSLLALWGVDAAEDPQQILDEIVLAEDRPRLQAVWSGLLARGGRAGVEYRIRHGQTGETRYIHGMCEVELAESGHLLRAATTQVDVTEMAVAREQAAQRAAEAVRHRELLLRGVSDLLAVGDSDVGDTLQATTDMAVEVIGESCVLRLLDRTGSRVERYALAHRDEAARRELAGWLDGSPQEVEAMVPVVREVIVRGQLLMGDGYQPRPGEPTWSLGKRFIVAPVRHRGRSLGALTVTRPLDEPVFTDADADLVQVLADRVGAAVDAEHARADVREEGAARRILDRRLAELSVEQQALLVQLDDTEARERQVLAEAIHDEPLQVIVAAMLRLDVARSRLPEPEAETVDQVAGLLQSAVEQLRRLTITLTPPELSAGLRLALLQVAEAAFGDTGVVVTARGPDRVALDRPTQDALYRIMREAIINARKHARASELRISVSDRASGVRVSVQDDGVGIVSSPPPPGHLGVGSMQARAQAIGGRLRIQAAGSGGTRVTVMVPPRD